MTTLSNVVDVPETAAPVSCAENSRRDWVIEVEITGPTIDENLAAKVRYEVKKAGLRLFVNATRVKDAVIEVATMRCRRDLVPRLDPVFKMLSAEFGAETSTGVKGVTFVAVYERRMGNAGQP